MKLKPRTILVGVAALAIWGAATKFYLDWQAENRQAEQRRAERPKSAPAAPPKLGPGIGDFETYFTEQHQLSTKLELTRRLMLRPKQLEPTTHPDIAPGVAEDSCEISKQIYRIYVPENYTAEVPHGIIYYLGYKDTTAMPFPWKPTLDEKHLIFISIRNIIRPDWQHAAAALDAVHNLKKQYTIDPRRVYLYEFPTGIVGQQMGLGLPDIFTGFVHINRLDHYRSVRVTGQNLAYSPQLGAPSPELLASSKARPHAFVLQDNFYIRPGVPDKRIYFRPALEIDGFTRLLFLNITDPEELHYPNFHGPWLAQVLEFLEREGN